MFQHRIVVDAVHARGDDDAAQAAVPLGRQFNIRVMEQDGDEQQGLPKGVVANRSADQRYLQCAEWDGKQQFAEVEADGRGGIAVEIDVMRQVKSPQQRDLVRQHVPDVKRVVEQQNRGGGADQGRERERVHQSPVTASGVGSQSRHHRLLDQCCHDAADRRDRKIPRNTPDLRFALAPQCPA